MPELTDRPRIINPVPSCCEQCAMDYYEREHDAWQADYNRQATPQRLAELFPGMESTYTTILRARIASHKAELERIKSERARMQGEYRKPSQRATVQLCLELCDASSAEHERAIKKLSFQASSLTHKTAKSTTDQSGTTSTPTPRPVTDADIARAKEYPIADILSATGCQLARSTSARLVTRCPLGTHTEKTPSFTVYTTQNSYYCYSCHASGDSIALYMALMHSPFTEAVRRLQP